MVSGVMTSPVHTRSVSSRLMCCFPYPAPFSGWGFTARVRPPDLTPERATVRCRPAAAPTWPDRPGGCAFDPHLLFMAVTVDSLFLPPCTEVSSGLLTLATASAIAAWEQLFHS